jgi:Na+-translocating ferredoxin:NAD+ oxidoreductase RnfD subunit
MPVVLPKPSDPRLHLAAVITSLQVLGQAAFHFRVSIAQILLALGTCAVLEIAITARKQKVWMWPASALLTGNGVAFILRVPGTVHGDWWSLHGWWIFVATAGVSLLSKYAITWRGGHIFNPSNIGLVACFLILGRNRAEPLDFWWGPMSVWLALALAIIVTGGFLILSRLKLLVVAVGFWVSFAAGIAVLSATGHSMTARWHLGPIEGWHFWWVLLTSPEVLVFLFYMITDPKTAPAGRRPRLVYAVAIGLLAALLIAPMQTEWASKVALLGALAIVCAARPLLGLLPVHVPARPALAVGLAAYAAVLFAAGIPARTAAANAGLLPHGALPAISIAPSRGVDVQLTQRVAKTVAASLVAEVPMRADDRLRMWLEQGRGQSGPTAVVTLAGRTYRLTYARAQWTLAKGTPTSRLGDVRALPGYELANVAHGRGIAFRQGSFRNGVNRSDTPAMMGGGLCWLDYDNDGWMDLFVVNSPSEGATGAAPRTALYHNVHGRFVNVSARAHAALPVRGEGCVAADLNGDGRTDLFVTTSQDDVLLWNNGNGTFTEGARSHGIVSFGWHAGAAVADVNGDGRPDLYVAGYTERDGAIPGSVAGFPTNHLGVRDELFLNVGHGRFRDVGPRVGLDPPPYDHSLGALFTDVNGDGRPDLYVANDEDPNKLYLNEPGGPLGFHFVDVAKRAGVADPNAGMGIAAWGRQLFVSNSRAQTHANYVRTAPGRFQPSLGLPAASVAGWGASWVDLRNTGVPDLVLANGAIPITRLRTDAERIQVFVPAASDSLTDAGVAQSLRVNGRGLAAADFDNDGRVDVAVNSIGGPLLLLRNTSRAGHWLEVSLRPFAPGARVSVDGVTLEAHAGSSYLSSEDPRLHFGLGRATRVRGLTVRWPDGRITRMRNVRADRIVEVSR